MPLSLFLLKLHQDPAQSRIDIAPVRVDAEVRTAPGPVSGLDRDRYGLKDRDELVFLIVASNSQKPEDLQ